jgi:hypothetical protein
MTMADWETEVDNYLRFMERPVLGDAGRVSHDHMERIALDRYRTFDANRRGRRRTVEYERCRGRTADGFLKRLRAEPSGRLGLGCRLSGRDLAPVRDPQPKSSEPSNRTDRNARFSDRASGLGR